MTACMTVFQNVGFGAKFLRRIQNPQNVTFLDKETDFSESEQKGLNFPKKQFTKIMKLLV